MCTLFSAVCMMFSAVCTIFGAVYMTFGAVWLWADNTPNIEASSSLPCLLHVINVTI